MARMVSALRVPSTVIVAAAGLTSAACLVVGAASGVLALGGSGR